MSTPFLSVWAPGHGEDVLPKGTGISLPKGSLVIEQVHYNLLVGDKPVTNGLVLHTVPMSTPLLPMQSQYLVAPPNIPCPAGVTGPLCNYQASLNYLNQRFGSGGVEMAKGIDQVCGENPDDPPVGDTATCTWRIGSNGYIDRIQPHMHLLGVEFTMVLNPGTPQAKTILNVPNYNFDYQKAYNVAPIPVSRGEQIQINCSYNPRAGARVADPPQGAAAFRHVRRRIIRRDVRGGHVADVVAAQLPRLALSDRRCRWNSARVRQ